MGNGLGSFGKAVTSNSRGPRYESSHRQTFYYLYIVKTKIKAQETGISIIILKN